MPEKFPTPENNPEDKKGKKPETPKFEATTEEGKKIEGEVLLSEQQIAEYLADHESMQREMFGGKEHIVLRGMSVKRAKELTDAMGTRGLTVEELVEAMGHDSGFAQRAKEKVKALRGGISTEQQLGEAIGQKGEFSVVALFEEVKSILAKESPTAEELEKARRKFAEVERIRTEYVETVSGVKGPEEEQKAHTEKFSMEKGGKEEILLIRPSEFFEIKAKLENK